MTFTDATAKFAMKHYTDQGLTPVQAAAIVGAFIVESGLNPTAVGDKSLSSRAHGLAQWRGPRWEHMQAYAKTHHKSEFDLVTQLDFALSELNSTERMAGTKLFQAKTVEEAAEAMIDYERPGGWTKKWPRKAQTWPQRLAQAKRCLALIGSGSTTDSETSTSRAPDRINGGF